MAGNLYCMLDFAKKVASKFSFGYYDYGGYDAVKHSRNRRSPRRHTRHEDDVARQTTRQSLIAQGRDRRRNFSILRWMISKHLDFVVPHRFKAKTGDKAFDKVLEQFVKFASQKKQFDSAGKHSRNRAMRLFEAHRVLDGDVFGHKLRGGFLQGIEGDMVRTPGGDVISKTSGLSADGWCNGVKVNAWSRETQYAVHKRVGTSFTLERVIRASRIIVFGYYDRFQQVRGISPITSALKEMGDVYEGFDYALAREKVNQLFALAITRDAEDAFFEDEDEYEDYNKDEEADTGTLGTKANGNFDEPRKLSFDKGPQVLDLDPGEAAAFLSAQGTTDQSQSFWDTVIAVCLKSIDIPFSFFREDFTNFFGSRAALILYLRSCQAKREDVVDFSNEWLTWRLQEGVRLGEIEVPEGFDIEMAACQGLWKWIPLGMPWWNPVQEVTANVKAVDNYMRSRTEIRAEQFGDDWEDMMEERMAEDEFLRASGLPTTIPDNPVPDAVMSEALSG